jgi:hypothetical protein
MSDSRQQLIQLFDTLDSEAQQSLLDFAEFLQQKHPSPAAPASVQKHPPLEHPRPADENVVNAIKRLRASYFMLNADGLLNEASTLMAQFMIQGRPASDVIDDLENLFASHYQKYLES